MSLVESSRPQGQDASVVSFSDFAARKDPRVGVLRELLRHLQPWLAAYESDGVDVITHDDGGEWSIWDVMYLVEHCVPRLPKRQREAINYCLIQGMREQDVAVLMGISPTNPVASYATSGLKNLLLQIDAGAYPRLRSLGSVG